MQYTEGDALGLLAAAAKAQGGCDCAEVDCEHSRACAGAEAAAEEASDYLVEHNVPRTWELTEDGEGYANVIASSKSEALARARENVQPSNYEFDSTIWVNVMVRCNVTGEEGTATVALDPDEPECSSGDDHDWCSDYKLVGGCKQNPGVWGNGAGLIRHEACRRCGCTKITDTWATRPDTGEQGLTSVRYEVASDE